MPGKRLLATAACVFIAIAGCGSSKPAASGGTATGSTDKTFTIGVLTDRTGPASSGNKTSVDGVKAGTALAEREGYKIKYVVADTATSPATALAAAQKLVTRDHVFAVIAHSALTFAVSNYLTARGVPVVGVAEDGPEWLTAKNMFAVFGALQTTKVSTTSGKFFKSQGVTKLASLGYSISPSSSEEAKAAASSAKAAGIKIGYLNAAFPFGSTNVGPTVLAMKKARVDGLIAEIDPNTAFALITGLREAGVNLKAVLLPTGYGGDLLQAGPGALRAAQNVFFAVTYEPVEMRTTATKQFVSDLASAGVTGEPTFAQYNGYVSVGLLIQGLKAAGANPSRPSLISALSNIHDFNALGLFGSHTLDVNDRVNIVDGVGNCLWIVKLEKEAFKLTPGATPICGSVIQGEKVSPSS
ncbi:MAG: ABC transporter substrate-binding protein [Frankia sp.]